MRTLTLSFRGCGTIADAHALIAHALPAPDYYGMNLDALYDVLTDIASPTVVHLSFAGCLIPYEDMRRLLRVFRDAERDCSCLGVIVDDETH